MGVKIVIFTILIALISVYLYLKFNEIPPVPEIEETWWGRRLKSSEKEDTSIHPFKIAVSDEVLNDLNKRLSSVRRFTPSLEGTAQEYGMNSKLLSTIVDFWRTKYNWREREKFLNQYPQYKVSVQGLKIHYLHVKPKETDGLKVLPLLLLHGWPGSVREFYEIIPYLTQPQKGRNFVFEVIVPSLPGYGFSDGAVRPGLGAAQVAVLFKNFMARLGFQKYYLQGGDWGAAIVQVMSILYPEKVIGVHSNMCTSNAPLANLLMFLGSFYPPLVISKEHEHKVYPLSQKFYFLMLESGYMHLQSTKPDTVGVALNDSPVGLAAYLIEKFPTWTNPAYNQRVDGGLNEKFPLTNLLDNIMIYWISGSITTSVRLYAETMNATHNSLGIDQLPVTVPSGCARFSNELVYSLDAALKMKYHNLVHLSDYEGGHFPAFEVPNVLAKDIYDFVEKVNKRD